MQSRIEEVLNKLEQPLLHYVNHYTNDVESSRDIVQEAFVKFQKHLPDLEEKYQTPWLYKVCRNCALDWKRRRKRIVEVEEHVLESHRSTEPIPSVTLERKEQVDALMEFVETLPEKQQEVLRLCYQAQMSYKEISDITGLSVSNIGYILSTALKTLRNKMLQRNNDERILRISKESS